MPERFFQQLESVLPVTPLLRRELAQLFELISLPRHSMLLEPGQVANKAFFILKGSARFYHFKGKEEISHWFAFEGDFIAALESFTTRTPSYEGIQLLENSQLISLHWEQLQQLYQQYHEWERAGRLILENFTSQFRRRTMLFQAATATEKYQFLLEQEPRLIQRVPLKYIASYLDISCATLSRIRSRIR